MRELVVVKIGGNVIDDPVQLDKFLQEFAGVKQSKVLVHGGGKIATRLGDKLGIVSQYVGGRRITDEDTLGLVTMVYGGLVNKQLVAALQGLHCNALGLTGADGNVVRAEKRATGEVDYGYVGDVKTEGVNKALLSLLLDNSVTPVMAPLTHDGKGSNLNTNADTIAKEIAVAMSRDWKVTLIYCFEKPGLLRSVEDEASVIARVNRDEYSALVADGTIAGGMLPKMENAFAAAGCGVEQVVIGSADYLPQLIDGSAGTQIATQG